MNRRSPRLARIEHLECRTLCSIVAASAVAAAATTGTRIVHGLNVSYYDNADFTGASHTRLDSTVNFDWGGGSPAPGIHSDNFSARWTGVIVAQSAGPYTFYTSSDDGVRLWVGGQ